MIIWKVSFYDETGAMCEGTNHPRTYCPTRTDAKNLSRKLRTHFGEHGMVDGNGKSLRPDIEKVELDSERENCGPRGDLCNVLNRLDMAAFVVKGAFGDD